MLLPNTTMALQVEDGFASKAERRLAFRLHALLETAEPKAEAGSEPEASMPGATDSAYPAPNPTAQPPAPAPQNEARQLMVEPGRQVEAGTGHDASPFAAAESQAVGPPPEASSGVIGAAAPPQRRGMPEDWYYKDPTGVIQVSGLPIEVDFPWNCWDTPDHNFYGLSTLCCIWILLELSK